MFGNADRHPFHPDGNFVAFKPFTLNGVSLSYGDPVNKEGVEPRLLRALYDQRKIDYGTVTAKSVDGSNASDTAANADFAKSTYTDANIANGSANKKDGHHKVKHAGLGGWKVIDPKGVPVGPGHKTKAEAQAEADRLNAKG